MNTDQDETVFPVSTILARMRPPRRLAPGREFDECAGACLGLCQYGPCPLGGCRLESAAFAGGPRGPQLEFDFKTRH